MHENIEKIATQTPDLAHERQEQLRALFPEAWSEGELDWGKLRQALGDLSDERSERYLFSWAGKRDSLKLLQSPSHATLRPAPDESLSWDETQNLFIEGDNLEALKLLYKPLFGRVKMIYIDPPYNTGNDFVYPDNFADPLKNYLVQTGQRDANGDLQTSNLDTTGRIHSRWLSMMYPRLFMARQLLKDDGVIFVSIDDNEVHHLRLLMNEVFGEENFVAAFIWEKRTTRENRQVFSFNHDYVLCYARGKEAFQVSRNLLPLTEEAHARYSNPDDDPRGDWQSVSLNAQAGHATKNQFYTITTPGGKEFEPPPGRCWVVTQIRLEELIADNRVWFGESGNNAPRLKVFKSEANLGLTPHTLWKADEVGTTDSAKRAVMEMFDGQAVFDTPKPVNLLKRMLVIATGSDDIILDFFAGSGTTAQAVLELNREDGGNRRFVLVQLPEKTGNAEFPTIADIAKERIRRVIGRMTEASRGKLDLETREVPEDLGFKVWKLGESHFRQMQPTPPGDTTAYLAQLELMNDALLPGSDTRAVLHEVALKEGFGLNARLQVLEEVTEAQVWRVLDEEKGQSFFACLDDGFSLESLRPLKLGAEDLFICRSVALDDTTAANLALQCRLKMI